MRWLLDRVCKLLHYTWGIPVWNRSVFLTCPITWACHRSDRFERWYWGE